MRLFFYYVLHSSFNALRKLFKTWVLIFILVCFVMGGLIGGGAAIFSEHFFPDTEQTEAQTAPAGDEIEAPENAQDIAVSALDGLPVEAADLIELVAGAIIALIFLVVIMGADKNGSKIFLPADVNLLFPSPMRPQSVLLFRLLTQMGTILLSMVYLLFQLPNLLNMGLSLLSALLLFATMILVFLAAKLIQVLCYVVFASRPGWKPMFRRVVFGVPVLALAAFYVYHMRKGGGWIEDLTGFFCAPASRWVPFWGWLKGIARCAVTGQSGMLVLFVALTILGSAGLCWLIWSIKADFYEDAMAQSEQTAELLAKAQAERTTGIVRKRKKDRSDKLLRDGLNRGEGANVYFYKALYNRFRFAHLRVFTKTSETYLVISLLLSLFLRYAVQTRTMIPVGLVLAGCAFYRALGNALAQDVSMPFFQLIPESTRKKLLFSLLGGSANCFLDVLCGMIPALIVLRGNVLSALGWTLFAVSVDFYATNVGAFIDFTVPVKAGKSLKALVQVMFLYFGLVPCAAVIAIAFALHAPTVGILICSLVNVLLGLLFFLFFPLALDHGGNWE